MPSVYLAGVAAAIAFGKFVPLSASMRGELELSFTSFEWLVSIVMVVAATLGLPVGIWLRRHDAHRALIAGLCVMGAAGAVQALTTDVPLLYFERVVEGAGYLVVVVTGPLLLSRAVTDEAEAAWLALWSTFLPVGLAIASLGGALEGVVGWRTTVSLASVPAFVAVVGLLLFRRGDPVRGARVAGSMDAFSAELWLALAFALAASLGISLLAIVPALAESHDVQGVAVGLTTAVVALAGVPGSIVASALLKRGHRLARLVATGAVMPLAAAFVFWSRSWSVAAVATAVILFVDGVLLATMYAAVPLVARGRLERAYGALVQAGSLGALLGPPLFGVVVATAGWGPGVPLIAAFTAGAIGAFYVCRAHVAAARPGNGGQ
ncbi:MAG TPA: MFS transporter [Actinomycetota bacterium]|nr:MFS transporter [Actinomycetota bacterium]